MQVEPNSEVGWSADQPQMQRRDISSGPYDKGVKGDARRSGGQHQSQHFSTCITGTNNDDCFMWHTKNEASTRWWYSPVCLTPLSTSDKWIMCSPFILLSFWHTDMWIAPLFSLRWALLNLINIVLHDRYILPQLYGWWLQQAYVTQHEPRLVLTTLTATCFSYSQQIVST